MGGKYILQRLLGRADNLQTRPPCLVHASPVSDVIAFSCRMFARAQAFPTQYKRGGVARRLRGSVNQPHSTNFPSPQPPHPKKTKQSAARKRQKNIKKDSKSFMTLPPLKRSRKGRLQKNPHRISLPCANSGRNRKASQADSRLTPKLSA